MARVPTQTFLPSSDNAIARPPGRPLAHSSTLKPAGAFSLLTGISPAGVSVIRAGCGAFFDSAIAGGLPWCHAGGGLGLSWENAGAANAAATPAMISLFMVLAPLGGRY